VIAVALRPIYCDNDRCPAFARTGMRQKIGRVAGHYELKCPKCRQFSTGEA
jgi:hypothetical protein